MIGVRFGNLHSHDDFGLILSSKTISPPEPQTKLIEVPLRNGSIDLSESLTGDVGFKDRSISMTFSMIDKIDAWVAKVSEIENYLHGQRMKIIFDDDQDFYYIGRITVNSFSSEKSVGTLVIDAVVEPYKYDVNSTVDEWDWDTFDFETGVINETSNIEVNGTKEVILTGRRKKTYPVIISSSAMSVSFKGKTYNLKAGTNKIYEIIVEEGENLFVFNGTGIVTIDYRGGSL